MTQATVLPETPNLPEPTRPPKSRAIPALIVALVLMTIAAAGLGLIVLSTQNASESAQSQRDDAQAQVRRVTDQRSELRDRVEACSAALDAQYYVTSLWFDFSEQTDAFWASDVDSASESLASDKLDSISSEIDTAGAEADKFAADCDGGPSTTD